jgi:hypothetical protein
MSRDVSRLVLPGKAYPANCDQETVVLGLVPDR